MRSLTTLTTTRKAAARLAVGTLLAGAIGLALPAVGAHADTVGGDMNWTVAAGQPLSPDPTVTPIGSFTDQDGDISAVNGCPYTVSLDWGDGAPVEGTRINNDLQNPDQCDVYALDQHAYAIPGQYTVSITISDDTDGSSLTETDTVTVTSTRTSGESLQVTVNGGDWPCFNGFPCSVDLGTVGDANGNPLDCSTIGATIDWGDGSTSDTNTDVQLVSNGDGTCEIEATHAYDPTGRYTVTVEVADSAGDEAGGQSEVTVYQTP